MAVKILSDRHRTVIRLRMDGLTFSEIAKCISSEDGKPISNVRAAQLFNAACRRLEKIGSEEQQPYKESASNKKMMDAKARHAESLDRSRRAFDLHKEGKTLSEIGRIIGKRDGSGQLSQSQASLLVKKYAERQNRHEAFPGVTTRVVNFLCNNKYENIDQVSEAVRSGVIYEQIKKCGKIGKQSIIEIEALAGISR